MNKITSLVLQFYFETDQSAKQLAFELWKHREQLTKNYNNAYRPIVRGGAANIFSGFGLKNYIKTTLINYSKNKSDEQIIGMCKGLIVHKFIKRANIKQQQYPITTLSVHGIAMDDDKKHQDESKKEIIETIWNNNRLQLFEDYNYTFRPSSHRDFIKLSQPDRAAWTRGTKVQIYSFTFNGWENGTVIQVNRNLLTVAYGASNSSAYAKRKIIHRYDIDKIQSSDLFIYHRLCLKVGSKLMLYSLSNKCWCDGKVIEIAACVQKQNVFKVAYASHNGTQYKAKYVDRWSQLIRLDNEIDDDFLEAQKGAVYKKGTPVKVYSNSRAKWIDGIIEDTIDDLINVRYGGNEKLLSINSHQFRLIS